jgi:hypothetical protein
MLNFCEDYMSIRLVFLCKMVYKHLSRGTADEEPLVNGSVDLLGGELLVGRQRRKLVRADARRRVLDSDVGGGNTTSGGLASDKTLPGLGALAHNVKSVVLVLALASEGKLVLRLAIGNLVDTEPLIGGAEKTRQVSLNVLDVVQLGGERVIDINDNDLPVSLLLVEESHDTEDLDLLDLTRVTDELTDLADIERIVVALGLGLGVDSVRVLPGLGEGTVVPEVTLVGEAVSDVSKLALLDVLLDGVEELLLGDLKLSVGPSRNLNDHVQDSLLLVGVERNIVERRDGLSILLDVDSVLEGVGSRNLADGVVGGHVGLLL